MTGRIWHTCFLAPMSAISLLALTGCPDDPVSQCSSNADCRSEEVCVESQCREVCNSNLDCSGREACLDGVCMPAGSTDAATVDVATLDSSTTHLDAGLGSDAVSATDTARADGRVPDAGQADVVGVDARSPDSGLSDVLRPDAGESDRGGPPLPCGAISAIHDDFEDSIVGPLWTATTVTGISVSVGPGQLTFDVDVEAGVSAFAGLMSSFAISLLGDAIQVEVLQVVGSAGGEIYAGFYLDPEHQLAIRVAEEQIAFTIDEAITSMPYDPVAHRWWRIRELGGSLLFETSRDGEDWTTNHSAPTPAYASLGYVILGAGTRSGTPTAQQAVFDNLSVTGANAAWCPTSWLQDDFTVAPDVEWTTSDLEPTCTAGVDVNGMLELYGTGDPRTCEIWTSRGYMLDSVSVMIHEVSVDSEVFSHLVLEDRAGLHVEWGRVAASLHASVSGQAALVDEPAGDRRWLRVRRDADELLLEARADNAPWDTVHSISGTGLEGPLQVGISTTCNTCSGDYVSTSFDNYNLE